VRRAIFLIPGLRQKHISAHRAIPQRSKKNPNGPGLKVFAAALFHIPFLPAKLIAMIASALGTTAEGPAVGIGGVFGHIIVTRTPK